MEEIDIKKDAFKDRWVSYFDLLGFSDLVRTEGELHVFNTITTVIEESKRKLNSGGHIIERVWFSDSFIFYSPGDSNYDFSKFQQLSLYFFFALIRKEIPVRGALAYGKVYADKDNNIIFGEGLIEAYRYAENQDWIGLILTPTAVQRMEEIGLPAKKTAILCFLVYPFKKMQKGIPIPL